MCVCVSRLEAIAIRLSIYIGLCVSDGEACTVQDLSEVLRHVGVGQFHATLGTQASC